MENKEINRKCNSESTVDSLVSRLVITIEGSSEELEQIAGHISDGGGEEGMLPWKFEELGKHMEFDYVKCFSAWGYDPDKDGLNKHITVRVKKDD